MLKQTLITVLVITSLLARATNDNSISDRISKPLLVVLDEKDATYNDNIRYAIDNYWTSTGFSFITEAQFDDMKNNEENIFLLKCENQSVEEEGTAVYDNVLKLVYFVKSGKLVKQVAGTPVLNYKTDNDAAIISSIRILQDKLQFLLYKEMNQASYSNYYQQVDQKSTVIKLKKLYISTESLDNSISLQSIQNIYSGEVYIVSQNELNKLIDSKSKDIVYAVVYNKKTSGISYVNKKQIIDASTGEVVYHDETTTVKPEGITKKDLKSLAD